MTDNPLLDAALAYAARGWPVFPAHPKTKEALPERDRDGEGKYIPKTGGIRKATTDEATIRAWWQRWPRAIIVAAVGPEAGVFALDFDPRTDPDTGEVWTVPELIARTEARIGVALPATATARSPSGGEHWYYRWPAEGPPITGRDALKVEHVDVRGAGGGCNLPPSVRADGEAYVWLRDLDHLVDAPAELLAVLQKPPPEPLVPRARRDAGPIDAAIVEAVETYALKGLQAECRHVETAGSGSRNPQLNKSAFAVAGLVAATLSNGASVLSGPMARAMLMEAALGNPGRDDRSQIEATLDSGWTSGLGSPRDLSKIEDETRARLDRQRARAGGGGGSRPSAASRLSGASRGSAGSEAKPASPAAGAQQPRADAAPPGATDPPPDDPSSSSPAAVPPAPDGAGKKKSSQMGGSRLPPKERGPGECDDAGILRPQTDLGNAERWLMRHGHAFRWCPTLGWLAWDGRRWSRDDADMLLAESVYATVRSIQDEAAACAAAGVEWRERRWPDWLSEYQAQKGQGKLPLGAGDERFDPEIPFDAAIDDDPLPNPDPWVKFSMSGLPIKRRSQVHAAWGRTSEGEAKIKAIAKLIVPYVTIRLDCFDADPMRFNVANGTLRFIRTWVHDCFVGTVELLPHDPADLMTMIADVEFDRTALCPVYDAFLARVQPDAAIRAFLHAWGGYSLTGDVSEQKIVINHGASGSNGKSTWIGALAHVMGDYAISVPIEVFLDSGRTRNAGAPSPDLAELPRRRMVRTSEPPPGVPFAESLLKLSSGGETIRARHLNMGFFEYFPEFKITVSMNPSPKLSDDAAIWRRVRIVPWHVSVTGPDVDKALPSKLVAESSGILNRMIEGLIDWLQDGLPAADAIDAATKAQRDVADPLSQFLALACETDPARWTGIGKLRGRAGTTEFHTVFVAWQEWSGTKGKAAWTQRGLAEAMAKKGFEKVQSDTMWFTGVELIKSAGEFVNPHTGKAWTRIGGDGGFEGAGDQPGPEPPDMGR